MITIICSIISSVLYHAGGLSQDEKYWIPKWLRHTWVRDWLCPLFFLLPLFPQHPSWWFVLAYGAMGGALTTYWDKWFKFDNYWFAGFMVGFSMMPLIFAGFIWWHILIRAIFIAISWGVLCKLTANNHVEEHGRGFLANISDFII